MTLARPLRFVFSRPAKGASQRQTNIFEETTMKYCKTIRNITEKTLTIGLPIRPREHASLEVDSKVLWCTLGLGEATVVELANQEEMPHLNGLYIKNEQTGVIQGFRVARKSDSFDNTLNTNDTLAISSVTFGDIKVSGSNH